MAKGAKFEELIERSHSHIKAAILIGTDRELIAKELTKHHIDTYFVDFSDGHQIMEQVVKKATELAAPGDTVLLAPACASMDQFKNYADRGDQFADAVRRLA